MSRPYATEEALESHECDLTCPDEFCDSYLSVWGACDTCCKTWAYCPVCLYVWDTASQANDCYEGCATVLDRIVDALD
jgi:hypothetical protein